VLSSASFHSSGKFLTLSLGNDATIFDLQTLKEIDSFSHPSGHICFDASEAYVISSDNRPNMRKTHIFSQYNDYTLEQLLLKKTLLTWLLIEKPNKKIRTHQYLLEDVTLKCSIPYDLLEIWETFPHNMQMALWRTMEYRIQKYGKDYDDNKCVIQ
jgi:hypothetical protein